MTARSSIHSPQTWSENLSRRVRVLGGILGLVAAALAPTNGAFAGNFAVTPTAISLSPRQHSSLLKLKNQGDSALRFQVSVFSWTQDPSGAMTLTPSTDLVVYPTLFSVAPGETRSVRVGTEERAAASESSYRVVVAELPSLDNSSNLGVRMVTRMSFPVFLQPSRVTRAGDIAAADLSGGNLSVRVSNQGNVHEKLASIQVIGRDAAGKTIYMQKARGWYVLPGEDLLFNLPVPAETCPKLQTLDVRADAERTTWSRTLPVKVVTCAP